MLLWLKDADEIFVPLELDPVAIDAEGAEPVALEVDLPEGAQPWSLAGLDVELGEPFDFDAEVIVSYAGTYDVGLTGVAAASASGEVVDVPLDDATAWRIRPIAPESTALRFQASDTVTGVTVEAHLESADRYRLAPGAEVTAARLPVVATDAALDDFGLSVGDLATVRTAGASVQVEVAAGVQSLPGVEDEHALLMDLPSLNARLFASTLSMPRANEVWIRAASGADNAVAAAAADVAGPEANLVTRVAIEEELGGSTLARQGAVAFWVVALAGVVLVVAGTAASAAALVGSRRGEVTILRALGLTATDQVRIRRREQLAVAGGALVAGVVAGAGVAVLAISIIAEASIPGVPPGASAGLRVAAGPLAAIVTAVAVGVLAVVAWQGRAVRRMAGAAGGREELE